MRRESLSTQGEFDLDGTKANHDGHLDASIIDRTGATEIVDESDQGDRQPTTEPAATRATAILWHLGKN